MTRVLIVKNLVLKGSTTKIEDKQVPGIYIYTHQLCHIMYIIISHSTVPSLLCV